MLAWADEEGPRNHHSERKRQLNSSPVRSNSPTKKSFGRRNSNKWANNLRNVDTGDKQIFLNVHSNGIGRTRTPPPPSPARTSRNKQPFPSSVPEQAQAENEVAKSLSGKTLTSIYRSPDHPTLFFHFADGTAYQVLVAGYDPNSHCPSSPTTPSSPSAGLGGPGTIQKQLELAPFLDSLAQPGQTTAVDLNITHAALIRLADKAFERKSSVCQAPLPSARTRKISRQLTSSSNTSSEDQEMEVDERTPTPPMPPTPTFSEQKWNQHHMSLALKFEGVDGWHCISANMQSRPTPSSENRVSNFNSSSNTNLNSPTFLPAAPDANGEIFRSYEDIYLRRIQDRQSPNGLTASVGSMRKKHARQNSEWSEWSFGSG